MHGADAGAGSHVCSNTMIYVDNALGVPTMSLVSWNETRDFLFHLFSMYMQGPQYGVCGTYECGLWIWIIAWEYRSSS